MATLQRTIDSLAGRSRQEIYECLLCEFQQEHARQREWSIMLQLFDEEVFQLREWLRPKCMFYSESIVLEQKLAPLGEHWNPCCDSFRVVCVPYSAHSPTIPQHIEQSKSYKDAIAAWDRFSSLATQVGAYLPMTIRDVMPTYGENPLATWLQLMFCTLRPQVDLKRVYGDRCNLSHFPFADAADVIEQCRLNTNDPILPPVLQERKERIDAIPKAPVQSKGEKTQKPAKKVRKRGRPSDTDHDEDRRIYEAWQTKKHETYVALARVRGKKETGKDIERAIDRHRQRTNRGNAS